MNSSTQPDNKSPRRPLQGIKVLEIASMGPGPFTAMVLADLGANVLTVRRPGETPKPNPVLNRNRAGTVLIDMKSDTGRALALDLVTKADVLQEGFRPGVMERLSLGPNECLARNPALIYSRITGWGRSGPLAHSAGHDINYISLSGALHAIGTTASGPVPPLNLVGDYGGGGLLAALGIITALFERTTTGQGQVVDTAMTDGSALLMAPLYGLLANGRWSASRAANLVDGSAYYYRCYQCADNKWMSAGAIEMHFRRTMLELLGLASEADDILKSQDNDPSVHERLEGVFREQPRDHWERVFEGSDACVAPVLSMDEVINHPQNRHWQTFREIDGAIHPMPAPRFAEREPGQEFPTTSKEELIGAWGVNDLPLQQEAP